MKNKVWILLLGMVFVGCTKTMTIDTRGQTIHREPIQGEPVITYEETLIYDAPQSSYEIRTTRNEVPSIAQPVPVRRTQAFNISPLEVFDKLQENQNILLLDVRMVHEIAQDGKIANSLMIPIQVLAQNLNRLDKSKRIIVYCNVGNRSAEATKLLQKHGFDAINMLGGITAWKREHLSVRWK